MRADESPVPPSHLPEVAAAGELPYLLPSPAAPAQPSPKHGEGAFPQDEGVQTPDLESPSPLDEANETLSESPAPLEEGHGVRAFDDTEPILAVDPRIDALDRKIMQYPDAPVNYVLRGEVYLDQHQTDLAAADFRKAIALAEAQDEALDWGYINAAYIDRAVDGLRACI